MEATQKTARPYGKLELGAAATTVAATQLCVPCLLDRTAVGVGR